MNRMAHTICVRVGGVLAAAAIGLSAPVLAQTRSHPAAGEQASGASAGNKAAVGHLSKFEARRIRHACVGRANESGMTGSEREAFLAQCYFGRVSHRPQRRECRQQGIAKGLDRTALRDFIRDCVKERTHQKD
jgi:hypothetical protein